MQSRLRGSRGARRAALNGTYASAVLIIACLCSCQPAAVAEENRGAPNQPRDGEDWPVFLGPRQTGVSGETGLLDKWPDDGPPVIWEKTVGTGYSAPSILGDRLVVHHRQGRQEIVECLRPDDGRHIWEFKYQSNFRDPYGYNNGPRCSPLLAGDRCYTFGAEGKLLCVDLKTGKQVWMRDTMQDFDVPQAFFGVGCTPILEGGKLIVPGGWAAEFRSRRVRPREWQYDLGVSRSTDLGRNRDRQEGRPLPLDWRRNGRQLCVAGRRYDPRKNGTCFV